MSRFRYAPTPSGFLHIGNGVNFVLTYLAAQQLSNSKILLRIDDLDDERKRPEYIEDIFQTLDWLHLEWHEGPTSPTDFEANWSQQHRLQNYENALQILRQTGELFACNQSRKILGQYGEHYPDALRQQSLSLDTPDAAWRIKTPENVLPKDFIVRRRDGIAAYQVASVVDDLTFGVTHLVRGADLRPVTKAQYFLAQTAHWTAFERVKCWHHPLILDEKGLKLSKSAGATALAQWRKDRVSPSRVYEIVAQTLGCPVYQGISLSDLVDFFTPQWEI